MRWAIGTPLVDATHWLFILGVMRYEKEVTLHFLFFWVMLGWD